MSKLVYKLNGEEQKILEGYTRDLQSITKDMVRKQDAVKLLESEIAMHNKSRRQILNDMAKRFGLTTVQVINKVLAENKKKGK
jgi:hypothetical protein